jgi:hypothetical protein
VRGYTIRSYYATLSKVFPSSLARREKNATRRAQIISFKQNPNPRYSPHHGGGEPPALRAQLCLGGRTSHPAPSCDWPSQMPLRTPTPSLPHSALSRERLREDRGGCLDAYPACDVFGLNIRMNIRSHWSGYGHAYLECNRRLTHDRPLDWAGLCFRSPISYRVVRPKSTTLRLRVIAGNGGKNVHLCLPFASEFHIATPPRCFCAHKTKRSPKRGLLRQPLGDETHTPHYKALC